MVSVLGEQVTRAIVCVIEGIGSRASSSANFGGGVKSSHDICPVVLQQHHGFVSASPLCGLLLLSPHTVCLTGDPLVLSFHLIAEIGAVWQELEVLSHGSHVDSWACLVTSIKEAEQR